MENLEPEVRAMGEVYGALKGLESNDVRKRVLSWAASKFSIDEAITLSGASKPSRVSVAASGIRESSSFEFGSLAEAFERASAKTDAERVLIAAAVLQSQGKQDLTGFEINSELKNLGRKASNITDAISSLMARKPQLMIQTKKDGSSRQAKKKYRVTTEGFKVAAKLSSGQDSSESE